jgi:hypothetical protein
LWNGSWVYIGALYATAVWLARRAGVDLPRRFALLFYLLVLAFLFRPLTTQTVSFPTDIQELVPPWSVGSALTKFTVSNPQLPDVTMQMVPWAHQVREAWRSGELPLWNALAGCGMPLAANGQSSAFSPFRILALPLPLGYAMTAEAAMKILVALTFMFLFCRRRGFSHGASAIAAISHGFSLFVIVWLHFTQATVAVFLPAVFYGIDLLAERVTASRFAAASILWACSVLGGHTETSARVAVFAAAYAIWRFVADRQIDRRHFATGVVAAGVVAAILASPLIVSMSETIPESRRYHELRSRPYGDVPFSDIPALLLLLQPNLFGSFPREQAWLAATHAESISGFAGILGVAGFLAAILRFRRDDTTFFALGWLTSFLAVANFAPAREAFYAILPYTAHARFRVILCFFGALLAGALADRLRERRSWIGLAGAAGLTVFAFVYVDYADQPAPLLAKALLTTVPAAIVLALALSRVPHTILATAVVVELWAAGWAWNPVKPLSSMYPKTPMIEWLQHSRGSGRFVGVGGVLFPNTNAVFGLEDVRVLDALSSQSYMEMIGFDTSEYYPKWPDPASPMLDRLNVRWIATEPAADLSQAGHYQLVYDGPDGRIYENRAVRPRFFSDRATVRVERLGAADFRVHVDAGQPALVVSSQTFWPGWRIESGDGLLTPKRVDGAMLGFVVPAGRTVARIRYFPLRVYACVALALVTFATLLTIAGRQEGHG